MEQTQKKSKFPTEVVTLPSKGLLYPEGHPLKSGTVEMKYMTAKEEDILTNQNYKFRDELKKEFILNFNIYKHQYIINACLYKIF